MSPGIPTSAGGGETLAGSLMGAPQAGQLRSSVLKSVPQYSQGVSVSMIKTVERSSRIGF